MTDFMRGSFVKRAYQDPGENIDAGLSHGFAIDPHLHFNYFQNLGCKCALDSRCNQHSNMNVISAEIFFDNLPMLCIPSTLFRVKYIKHQLM